jgi:hypothetical protein
MFARSISLRLKPNCVGQFTQLMKKETLPLLRKQKGFQDEITFVAPGEAQEHAERRRRILLGLLGESMIAAGRA